MKICIMALRMGWSMHTHIFTYVYLYEYMYYDYTYFVEQDEQRQIVVRAALEDIYTIYKNMYIHICMYMYMKICTFIYIWG